MDLALLNVLVLNADSSTLKGRVVDKADISAIAKAEVSLGADATRRRGIEKTVRSLLSRLGPSAVQAVGHRVVHGGTRVSSAVGGGDRGMKGIEALAGVSPLDKLGGAPTLRA